MKNSYRLFELAFANDAIGIRRELEEGADVAQVHEQAGHTALQIATVSSSLDAVKALLEAGADPNQRFSKRSLVSGTTHADQVALMYASDVGIIALLHSAGAILNAVDSSGATALSFAVKRCDPVAVELLLKLGASPCVSGSIHEDEGGLRTLCETQMRFWKSTDSIDSTERSQAAIADCARVMLLVDRSRESHFGTEAPR